MPETKKTEDELTELRERVKALEAQLEKEREKKAEEKEEKKVRVADAMEDLADEFNKLNRGFFYAGLESLAQTARLTQLFVDKTYERNKPEKRDTVTKQLFYLPWDMTEAFFDVLDESTEVPRKIVDKFYDKYKEEKEE